MEADTTPPPDRVDRLEKEVSQLAITMRDISLHLSRLAPMASPAPVAPTVHPSTASSRSQRKGKEFVPTTPATSSSPSAPTLGAHPPWEYKSSAPEMAMLGCIYEHLQQTGAVELAGQLYAAKPNIDYAFLPDKEASSSDDNDHTYTAKYSGKRWDTTYPPPRDCFTCGKRHWGKYCPQKTEQQKQLQFARGHAPARYYISKTLITFSQVSGFLLVNFAHVIFLRLCLPQSNCSGEDGPWTGPGRKELRNPSSPQL